MTSRGRQRTSVASFETREEAARGIAGALEFLRREAAAIGMQDVSLLIGLAHARLQARRAGGTGETESR